MSASMFTLIVASELICLVIFQYTALKHINPGKGNALELVRAALCIVGVTAPPVWHLIQECRGRDNDVEQKDLIEKERDGGEEVISMGQ